jgi:hypothetical protein
MDDEDWLGTMLASFKHDKKRYDEYYDEPPVREDLEAILIGQLVAVLWALSDFQNQAQMQELFEACLSKLEARYPTDIVRHLHAVRTSSSWKKKKPEPVGSIDDRGNDAA